MGNSRDVPLLLRVFRDEPSLRQVVVGALPFLGGKRTYGLAVRLVESAIRASPVDGVTASDAVELLGSFCRYYEPEIEQPVSLLIDVIQSLDLPADARASAACCLGHILERSDRRRRPWRRAAAAILEAIADSEAEVRHEAAHAAGDMRLNDAIPQLEAMAKADPGRGPWGAVAREARGALYAIEHGEWPEWWWEGGDAD